jgi:hypothetical protein
LEFADGTARLKGLNLTAEETSALGATLKRQGYSTRNEAQALVLQAEVTR